MRMWKIAVFVFLISLFIKAENMKWVFRYDKGDNSSWQSLNDNVMGGISTGENFVTEKNTLKFEGYLSLENNGGFASIRSERSLHNLKEFDTLVMKIKGDGREYYMNLHTDVYIPAGSYWAKFKTFPNKWMEIRIPLSSFIATSFGRQIPFYPRLNKSKIRRFGFIIADKKTGKFGLEVDWIKAVRNGNGQQEKRPKWSPQRAMKIIDSAIEKGVPVFNDGSYELCVAIYFVAVNDVLAIVQDSEIRNQLQNSIKKVRNSQNTISQAWILRYALDKAYIDLKKIE